ncbi:MAG: leucine-rich repeat protein [Muribaculaceae bacterium]|nr:leucine-rich repeat protein [Muribaculaceae bacterium]
MKLKKRTKLFQRVLLLMIVLILPQVVSAYDFMVNGIAYNIVSSANKTLEVTYKTSSSPGSDGSSNYNGNVVIGETVYYSGAYYTVIGIGEQAFKNSFISSLKLPETLTYIKKEAFSTCFSLSELSIPASVTEIGASCFWMCPDLKKVYSYATTPPTCTGTSVFSYMQYNDATLYVPYGCLSQYKNAYGWKDFPHFMEMAPMIDGHEYVDLQLPSGKLWATRNYGASSVSDYGTYVEWSSNDIVNSSWGSNWKTPTLNDIKELINNCSWIWTSVDGKQGYTVKGNNGNSIFLPAAGVKMGSVMKIGEWCYYWSSTPQSNDMVYILLSTASDVWYGSLNTMANLPIRPVADNPSPNILATGITLNKSELSLEIGNSETLIATVTPSNVTNGSVTWSSSNTSVVSVNSSGIVAANAAGSAVITASTTDGTNLSAVCSVTVNPAKITGDVNNDGEVNIADINTVIDVILGGHFDHISACDVNGDGEINIADINFIISLILEGK